MTKADKNDTVEDLTFEQSIAELKQIVDRIEVGQIPLQDSLAEYEKGMGLIGHCRSILQQAEKRIEKIGKDLNESETD